MTTTWRTEGVFGPPIHTYTRAQALADGMLIDAGPLAQEAGFRWPVALTQAAHAEAVAWNTEHEAGQDETGRLWDVLWLATIAARAGRSRFTVARVPNAPGQVEAQDLDMVLHVGPGDTAAPVVTISLPGRDDQPPRRGLTYTRGGPTTGPPRAGSQSDPRREPP